jgi:murein DD-endopeptidase MepM/ murein hydrolase activator NlpD
MKVARVGAWCELALVVAVAGCGDDPLPEAWMPTTGGEGVTTNDAAGPGEGSSDSAGPTSEVDPPGDSTSGGGESSGSSGSDTDTDTDTDTDEPMEVVIPQGMQLPFVCGDAWRLDTWGHAPALDMVREPDQVGTEGAPLHAPADGVVNQSYYHENAGNLVQIDHGGGYYTTYIHMESRAVEVGAVVVLGDIIGAVGRTGPTSNNHPHLHFELGFDADGSGDATWGFEGAERVNPWFDNVEYGQKNGVTWRDVVSNNCP